MEEFDSETKSQLKGWERIAEAIAENMWTIIVLTGIILYVLVDRGS